MSLVRWTCKYCNRPQETTALPPCEGLPDHAVVIAEAAKTGSIACWTCFHRLTRRLR